MEERPKYIKCVWKRSILRSYINNDSTAGEEFVHLHTWKKLSGALYLNANTDHVLLKEEIHYRNIYSIFGYYYYSFYQFMWGKAENYVY